MGAADMLSNDLVRRHFEMAVKATLSFLEVDLRANIDSQVSNDFEPPLESQLEAVFVVWMAALNHVNYRYRIVRQYWIDLPSVKYRADFAVFPPPMDADVLPILVEVDGHAFHEKTLEQVEERNRRDRLLQVAGYRVMHFSYSELTGRPTWCIEEVADAAQILFADYYKGR